MQLSGFLVSQINSDCLIQALLLARAPQAIRKHTILKLTFWACLAKRCIISHEIILKNYHFIKNLKDDLYMNKRLLILPASALCLSATSLIAQAEEANQELTWHASAELGYIKSSGNSDTETLNAKFNGETAYNKWTHLVSLEALKSASNDVRSAEKYRTEVQSDYDLGERSYAFGVANWENDNFNGLNYTSSIAAGYGYKAIKTDEMKLNLEVAPGYRIVEDTNNNTEEDAILRLSEVFAWKISKTSTLDQSLKIETGDSNTETRFGIALTNQVAGNLSMKVAYNLKHNSDVADGVSNSDRETAITLVYKL